MKFENRRGHNEEKNCTQWPLQALDVDLVQIHWPK